MKIYTDASTYTQNGISGLAFIATDARDCELFRNSTVFAEGDNNTAELAAILYAMTAVRNTKQHVTILTDSTYAKNAIETGQCRPAEKKILDTINLHRERIKCSIFWIKGHGKDDEDNVLSFYNKQADREAKNSVRKFLQRRKEATLAKSLAAKANKSR